MNVYAGRIDDAAIMTHDLTSFTNVTFVRCTIFIGDEGNEATFLGCSFIGCKIDRKGDGKVSYWRDCYFDTDCTFENEEETNEVMRRQRDEAR